jgi:hypothetical protein
MDRRRLVAAATRVAAVLGIAVVLAAAGFVLGCDVMQQDVEVTVPWHAPGEESVDSSGEDSADDSADASRNEWSDKDDSGGPSGGADEEDQAQKHEVERWL